MEWIRKSLGTLFAVLGTYYIALGALTLVRLPGVTSQWIERSGDPEFRIDSGAFMALTALGAITLAGFGWWTVVKGVATAQGRITSWLGLAIAALSVHSLWFLYRTMGAGVLDRQGQIAVQRTAAAEFGLVCVGYLWLWILTRRQGPSQAANARLNTTVVDAMRR